MKNTRLFCRTGEVTALLDLESHVLRYWESRFPKLVRPIRRADGRRLYRPEDVAALTAIKRLVRQKGFTVKAAARLLDAYGVEKILKGDQIGTRSLWAAPGGIAPHVDASNAIEMWDMGTADDRDVIGQRLHKTLNRLEDIKARIDGSNIIETGRVAA